MTPLYIFLALLCAVCEVSAVEKTSALTQDGGIKTAQVGENVTLRCSFQDDSVTYLSWYQQRLGNKPLLISTRMKHGTASTSPLYAQRFRVIANDSARINHLLIRDVQPVDSATYYCGMLDFNTIKFGQGVFLHVRTSSSKTRAVVQQPALVKLRQGEYVELSCGVHAETCGGEQSLYWFRHGAALPALIYPSEEQCKTDTESHMRNCTLKLPIESVSSSDAGVYYCALASCGEIIFGKGTRVKVTGFTTESSLLVIVLSAALAVSIIILLVLGFTMHKLKQQLCSVCKGTDSAASDARGQDADVLHYAALSLKRGSERHGQEDSEQSVCVYSRVKRKE